MALTDEGTGFNVSMPVAPAYMGGGYGNNGGFGGFGGDMSWLILLLLCCGGGWGGFGGFGGMGGFGGAMWDFPWLINGQQQISNNTNDGFRDAQLHDSITSVGDRLASMSTQLCDCCGQTQMSIANSTAGIQNSLCSGFAGVNAAINGAQSAISNQLYNNEIAALNRAFAEQTANTAGFNGVQSGLCDIRYGNATNTRDIIESQNRGTQAVLDKLCQLELDGYKREADQLRAENSVLKNQGFIANEINQQNEVFYNRLKNCPVNAVPVAGNTPLFSCNPSFNTPGCGCGNNF